jgi:hypothetical protein
MKWSLQLLKDKLPVTHDAWYVVVGMVIAAVMVLFLVAVITISTQNDIQKTVREIRTETETRQVVDTQTQDLLCDILIEKRAAFSVDVLKKADALPYCDLPKDVQAKVDKAIAKDAGDRVREILTPTNTGEQGTKGQPNTNNPKPIVPEPTSPTPTNPTPSNPTPTGPTPVTPTIVPTNPVVVVEPVVVNPPDGPPIVIDPTPLIPDLNTPQVDVCLGVAGIQPVGTVCISVGSIPLL